MHCTIAHTHTHTTLVWTVILTNAAVGNFDLPPGEAAAAAAAAAAAKDGEGGGGHEKPWM